MEAVISKHSSESALHRAYFLQVCLKSVAMMSVGIPPEGKAGILAVQLEYFGKIEEEFANFQAERVASAALREAAR